MYFFYISATAFTDKIRVFKQNMFSTFINAYLDIKGILDALDIEGIDALDA